MLHKVQEPGGLLCVLALICLRHSFRHAYECSQDNWKKCIFFMPAFACTEWKLVIPAFDSPVLLCPFLCNCEAKTNAGRPGQAAPVEVGEVEIGTEGHLCFKLPATAVRFCVWLLAGLPARAVVTISSQLAHNQEVDGCAAQSFQARFSIYLPSPCLPLEPLLVTMNDATLLSSVPEANVY